MSGGDVTQGVDHRQHDETGDERGSLKAAIAATQPTRRRAGNRGKHDAECPDEFRSVSPSHPLIHQRMFRCPREDSGLIARMKALITRPSNPTFSSAESAF